MLPIPYKVIATCFALTSFAGALAVGLFVGNPASTVLVRALLVMFACWCVGLAVAGIAQHAVDRHIDQYKQRNPIPATDGALAEGQTNANDNANDNANANANANATETQAQAIGSVSAEAQAVSDHRPAKPEVVGA